jgi:aminoglycoside phosphotransferase (APT) family kinase protein
VAAGARRSRSELAVGFGAWLTERDGVATSVEVTRPDSGLSSETVLLESTSERGTQSLVVRMPPSGDHLFPDYDLARQVRVQAALGATDVPVAEPLALETDPKWVGTAFLVMPRIPGRTLTNNPPYSGAGPLPDAGPEVQARVLDDMAHVLAQIHRLDLAGLDLGELSGGGPTLAGMLDYWEDFLTWATPDPEAAVVYLQAVARLRETIPSTTQTCLLWGDPQLVNIVYDDEFQIAAVLDWEMATTGPPEVDLGWFLTLHEGACETAGTTLAGDPGRAAFVATYAAALGRPVADLDWFELFAHVRSGALVLRIGELMAQAGVPNTWTAHVPQLRHVQRLLEGL